MKKSNIILLGLLSAILVAIVAIPVLYNMAFSAKRGMGEIKYLKTFFENKKVIVFENAVGVTVIPVDSLIVEIREMDAPKYQIENKGDTLIIRGGVPDQYASLLLFVPPGQKFIALDSRIMVKGTLYRINPPSLDFTLRNTTLYSRPVSSDQKVAQSLGHLTINDLNNSHIEFSGRLDIDHLTMRNVRSFSCTPDVGVRDTDFSFDDKAEVRTATCMEGFFVDSR